MPGNLRETEAGHAMIMISSHSVHDIRSAFGTGSTYTQKSFCGGVRYKAHNLLTLALR